MWATCQTAAISAGAHSRRPIAKQHQLGDHSFEVCGHLHLWTRILISFSTQPPQRVPDFEHMRCGFVPFLVDRTGRPYDTVLRLSSSVVCDVMYCG